MAEWAKAVAGWSGSTAVTEAVAAVSVIVGTAATEMMVAMGSLVVAGGPAETGWMWGGARLISR